VRAAGYQPAGTGQTGSGQSGGGQSGSGQSDTGQASPPADRAEEENDVGDSRSDDPSDDSADP
jgi:hypothetical protein